jgi:ribosomal protein L10
MNLDSPVVWHGQVDRSYPTDKTFLYNQYSRFLQHSTGSPIIFLHHADFKPQRLMELRRQISETGRKFMPPAPAGEKGKSAELLPSEHELPKLTVMRAAIFGVALRDVAPMDVEACKDLAQRVKGPFAVLSFPKFHPPQMNAVLRMLERAVPPKRPKTAKELAAEEAAKKADPATPGRRLKRVREELQPEMAVVGALIEGRVFSTQGLQEVAKLPTLDTLRAQIVGLLSAPAAQLAMVLSEASGGKLARTLEGLKKGLEEGQKEDTAS